MKVEKGLLWSRLGLLLVAAWRSSQEGAVLSLLTGPPSAQAVGLRRGAFDRSKEKHVSGQYPGEEKIHPHSFFFSLRGKLINRNPSPTVPSLCSPPPLWPLLLRVYSVVFPLRVYKEGPFHSPGFPPGGFQVNRPVPEKKKTGEFYSPCS